ncbi:CLUMA_CG020345, isoform A [Clunio marinus]|uniref:CLUMA_CG020345, isoform A n=1 Tax=Clunio marinus TaxID=568069 RepID=A0A1J1J4Q4_9DIPT|nr:CLUMA_CG020345, isoform A [Clunio marinus]
MSKLKPPNVSLHNQHSMILTAYQQTIEGTWKQTNSSYFSNKKKSKSEKTQSYLISSFASVAIYDVEIISTQMFKTFENI